VADKVDPKTLADAQKAAQRSGVPQPVKSRSGKVLYYVDHNGAVVPKATAEDARQRAGAATSGDSRALNKSGGLTTPAERKVLGDAAKPSNTADSHGMQQVWIDGHLMWVQSNVDENGHVTWTARPPGQPDAKGDAHNLPTAFDAIDNANLDPTAPFLMGYTIGGGATPRPGATDSQVSGTQSGARQAISKNMQTVGGSVSWLAALSTKDEGAYQLMLKKLNDAGYLSDADLATAGGKWSAAAGQAMVLAARDTAVVNTTANGSGTTLDQFLASKSGVNAASKAKAFTPVDRSYTDPESIKASAKSEAEQVLGRQLTPEEEAQLVGHFRSLEDAAFDAQDAAHKRGKAASYTARATARSTPTSAGPSTSRRRRTSQPASTARCSSGWSACSDHARRPQRAGHYQPERAHRRPLPAAAAGARDAPGERGPYDESIPTRSSGRHEQRGAQPLRPRHARVRAEQRAARQLPQGQGRVRHAQGRGGRARCREGRLSDRPGGTPLDQG
jgi:hypothetical protein